MVAAGDPNANNLAEMFGGLLASHTDRTKICIYAGPWCYAKAVPHRGESLGRHRWKGTQCKASTMHRPQIGLPSNSFDSGNRFAVDINWTPPTTA